MKLFITNKKLQGEINKYIIPLQEEIKELKRKIGNKEFRYLEEASNLRNKLVECEEIIKTEEEYIKALNKKVERLTEDKKLLFGAKGGLTKYVHRLEKELAEANEKLSQRYIIKELAPEKSKNTQVMKTKSKLKTSQIIKKVVEND